MIRKWFVQKIILISVVMSLAVVLVGCSMPDDKNANIRKLCKEVLILSKISTTLLPMRPTLAMMKRRRLKFLGKGTSWSRLMVSISMAEVPKLPQNPFKQPYLSKLARNNFTPSVSFSTLQIHAWRGLLLVEDFSWQNRN